jgi:membrane protein
MVGALGFLLIVSLLINSLVLIFSQKLGAYLPNATLIFVDIINLIITFEVLVSLFAVIYKVLPDAQIPWSDVIVGSVFTAVLFLLGKYLIGLYIAFTAVSSIYGAAGTVVVIAVWVYYTAAILFFGAEFTRAYAKFKGEEIKPSKFAVSIKQVEIEQAKKPVDLDC